jgi:hypothetical protein
MAPRIEAERELALHRAVTASRLKKSDREQYVSRLRRVAAGTERVRARKASAAELEALGVKTTEATPEILKTWGLPGGET